MTDNRYDLIEEYRDEDGNYTGDVYITKPLCISANGNVFPGAGMPYAKVDKVGKMFNILDLNSNLIQKVDEWSWRHPVTKLVNRARETILSTRWARKNGYEVTGTLPHQLGLMKNIDELEHNGRELHKMCPHLHHSEIQLLALVTTCMQYHAAGKKEDMARVAYLLVESGGDVSINKNFMNAEYLGGLMTNLITKNIERKTRHSANITTKV